MAKVFPFLIVGLVLGVVVYFALASSDDVKSAEGNETEQTEEESEAISVEMAEERVREIVLLDGQELTSTLLVNDEAALESLKQIAPAEVSSRVEVGDMYLVFTDTQVLYRPSSNRVVETVAVLQFEAPGEGEADLVEVPAPDPVPEPVG